MAIPAYILDPPPAFTPSRNGLLAAAVGPMEMPAHAETSGAQWWSEVCGSVHLYPPACASPPYPAWVPDTADGLVSAYPFVLYASEVCGTAGNETAEAERRVRQKLVLGEQYGLEKAFWGGGEGVTGILETLQAAGKVNTLAVSANVIDAVALLEQQAATAKYNGPLFIHARPMMGAYLGSKGSLLRAPHQGDGQRVLTQYGSEIVFGAGYSGNTPAGVAPTGTAEAMYITGRVLLWRSPDVWVTPGEPAQINTATNQRAVYAGRAYAIAVECLAAATLVTRAG
jgi:hypothetical protein